MEHDLFQESKLSEDQKKKKRSSPKLEKKIFLISSEEQKKGLHQIWKTFFIQVKAKKLLQTSSSARMQTRIKLLGRDADHSQIIGGDISLSASQNTSVQPRKLNAISL